MATSSGRHAHRKVILETDGFPVRSRASAKSDGIGELDTGTPVLILSASPKARRSPHGGVGIIRSLGRLGIAVYTVDSDPRGPASYSRYLRGRFIFDLATAGPEATVEYLLEVGKRLGSRAVLVPTWDDMAVLVSDHFDVLSPWFAYPQQPGGLAQSLASKKEMAGLAKRHAIPAPEASFPTNVEDVIDFAATATFPVMLKGISGNRLLERAGRKMVIVDGPDELVSLYREMEDPADPNLMLQEYIPGGDDVVWMFNGYFNNDSDCLLGFTGRKLRQTPVYTGSTSLGICVQNDEVDQTTRRWMKELGYRGVLDIGYRFDARDGRYKVLDVNPRIGGTFRLFVGHNGMDVARALYLDMTGQPVPVSSLVEGRKWMDERDLNSCLQYRRDHRLTVSQWATSLKGVQETVYIARDDLVPFWKVASYVFRQAIGRSIRRAKGVGRLPSSNRASSTQKPTLEPSARSGTRLQERVTQEFESTAEDWRTIYEEESVYARIHRERQATALDWIDGLGLPEGTPVLEIGCGAGLTAVALAGRGLNVTAIDAAPAMIKLTEQLARDRHVDDRLTLSVADAHDLPAEDGSYGLVVGLGVLPWLHTPDRALAEMARVVRPGGYILVNVDNLFRLHYLLDPRLNPAFGSVRRSMGRRLRSIGILRSAAPASVRLESIRRFDSALARLGLDKVRGVTMGFGPFTFWTRPILSESSGVRLHRTLQRAADRRVPLVRGIGAQYLVLARKADGGGPDSGRTPGSP